MTCEFEYLCEIPVFEDEEDSFLPLLGFSAFLGTNILIKKPRVLAQKSYFSALQDPAE